MAGLPFEREYQFTYTNVEPRIWEVPIPAKASITSVTVVAVGSTGQVRTVSGAIDLLNRYSHVETTGDYPISKVIDTMSISSGIATFQSLGIPAVNKDDVDPGESRENKLYLHIPQLGGFSQVFSQTNYIRLRIAGYTPVL